MATLALQGGPRAITADPTDALSWPQLTCDSKTAVQRVLDLPDYTFYREAYQFEHEIKAFYGVNYALAHVNGTAAVHAALFALGIGPGDEVIVPSLTYWASAMPILSCNATPVFAESDPDTLNIDPNDIETRITSRTRAIVVVHLCGLPCNMEAIRTVADKHDLRIIEDAAHVHDATYKGNLPGGLSDAACFSYQATKLLPGIEGGMLITNHTDLYERALALGHYERLSGLPDTSTYKQYRHTGFGYKYRIHPLSAAMLRVQFNAVQDQNRKREENLEYLNQQLDRIPGISTIKTPPDIRRNYYCYRIKYHPEELNDLDKNTFIAALQAEGAEVGPERYALLHKQPVFTAADPAKEGFPWRVQGPIVPPDRHLPATEALHERLLSLPTFPQASRELIDQYVEAFKKVTDHAEELANLPPVTASTRPDRDGNQMPGLR
jgi:dTDP-4-amino-4,6-dideoxygalactose transaminase